MSQDHQPPAEATVLTLRHHAGLPNKVRLTRNLTSHRGFSITYSEPAGLRAAEMIKTRSWLKSDSPVQESQWRDFKGFVICVSIRQD